MKSAAIVLLVASVGWGQPKKPLTITYSGTQIVTPVSGSYTFPAQCRAIATNPVVVDCDPTPITCINLSDGSECRIIQAGGDPSIPTYTTEPVTQQVAHCAAGWHLERWRESPKLSANYDLGGMFVAADGYYPVVEVNPDPNHHPDKCVKDAKVKP